MNKNFVISLFFLLGSATLSAQVKLLPIFSDNMVLQQQSEVTFSGTATSGKRVQATASWNNKKIQTNVDAKGEWKLSLQTPVAGGPFRTVEYGNASERIPWTACVWFPAIHCIC